MKLISLYIENFGGLSRYSLTFSEGVTVLAEPNGFGKTTLAEFIRAMFYGFPRKAKTLEKSRRQKFTPWNGGKYGGNLIFEVQGQQYRIERTFGATPKGDTFRVIDLSTNKKTDRFSEEIGVELFQLDGDSFERSTYMPQLSGSGSLSTNSIQAKLTCLVEDAADINYFDRAMETLRSCRSAYLPYRGSGGTVGEARGRITQLQQELDELRGRRGALEECVRELDRLEEAETRNAADLSQVRTQIKAASEAAAAEALRREYSQLQKQRDAANERLGQLRETYPQGLPTPEELDRAETLAREAEVLEAQQVTTQADLEAQRYVQANRARFEDRVPSPEELERRRSQHRGYVAGLERAEHLGLSEQDREQYEKLRSLYESGKLEEAQLEKLSQHSRTLEKLCHDLEIAAVSPEDEVQLRALERFFQSGVPDRADLEKNRQKWAESQQLRQQTGQLAELPPTPPAKQTSPLLLILTLLFGGAAAALGVVLLIRKAYLWGGIALGIGGLALIGAVFLGVRMMLNRALSGGISPELQAKIRENRMRIEEMEGEVSAFVRRYVPEGSLYDGLHDIADKARDFAELSTRRREAAEKRRALQAQADAEANWLAQQLGTRQEFDKAITALHLARSQFLDLQEEKTEAEQERQQLLGQARATAEALTAFLGSYYEDVEPGSFGKLLSDLQRESEAYLRCKAQTEAWQNRMADHREKLRQCGEALEAFFAPFGLRRESDLHRQLRRLREEAEELRSIDSGLAPLENRLEALRREGGEKLNAPEPEQLPDLELLNRREQELLNAYEILTQQKARQEQNRIRLREQVDRIPQLQDELDRWQEKKTSAQSNAQTLDDTMVFLEKAKDSLTGSYLGPIREHFAGYMARLTGQEREMPLISPELEIQLERQGQARELAYFSAGQTDLVMLCMRLALVDALFGAEKPFVILDDPFVNLDDERTREALKLLQELGRERQILYLVCNSSRTL